MRPIFIDHRTGQRTESASLAPLLNQLPLPGTEAFKSLTRSRVDSLLVSAGIRNDAAAVNAGTLVDRLTAKAQDPALEPLPNLNSFQVFSPYSQNIPRGAERYTIAYQTHQGRAAAYHSGGAIPRVQLSNVEDLFDIAPIVAAWDQSIFDEMSSEMSGLNTGSDYTRACSRVIQEMANELFWYGTNEANLYGFLNFPGTQNYVPGFAFNSAASASDVIAELNEAVASIEIASRGTLAPDSMVLSIRMHRYLSQTYLGAQSPNETILQGFLKQNPRIRPDRVFSVWELQNVGLDGSTVAGQDFISFFNADPEAQGIVMPLPLTGLTPFTEGLNLVRPYGMKVGGFRTAYPGSILHMQVQA
jgi:hypothetical protein